MLGRPFQFSTWSIKMEKDLDKEREAFVDKLTANPPKSVEDFVEGLKEGRYDDVVSPEMKANMLEKFSGTVTLDGNELPVNWNIDTETGKELEESVTKVINVCKAHGIPILFAGQIANMCGNGEFCNAAVVPGLRASYAMHYLTYVMNAFIGMKGSVMETKLPKEEAQAIANMAKLLFDADTGKIEGLAFSLYSQKYLSVLVEAVKKRMEKFRDEE